MRLRATGLSGARFSLLVQCLVYGFATCRCHSGGVRPLSNPKDDEESGVGKENSLPTTPRSIRFAQDDNQDDN